ncbi:hypothetical protein [Oceanidesulfovibrio indonesiensis]|uniref:hypothetical protein n=1 Tax=Oceanidesulfovibrio indonesiensis TaxID=54767 RepID=UPI00129464FA|nr:hypothetical protein [Oceanidesulfovibrio indonesiensis]
MPPLEQRIATPEEIAGVVSFLDGSDGAWINAQALCVNGCFAKCNLCGRATELKAGIV